MFDYEKALQLAKDKKVEPILDLISWSENYSWSDPSNPLVAFYAIAQIEEIEFVFPVGAVFGYVEIGYLGDALSCYASRPTDVTDFVLELQRLEDQGGEDF